MSESKKNKKVLRVERHTESGLSSFVERPVPTAKEVAHFDRAIHQEVREHELDSNLSEIYSDKNGQRVDVSTMKIKKRRPLIVRLLINLLILGLLAGAAYEAYTYWFNSNNDISALDFKITAPDNITAGQPFTYQIEYHNPTKGSFSNLHLELQYPSGFVFASSSLPSTSGNYGWNLPDLAPGETGSLTVAGQLINLPASANVITGGLSYTPATLSSQFKKETSVSTVVTDPGFTADLDYSQTAFLNQDNDMTLIFSNVQNNYLGDFNITFSLPNNASAAVATTTDETAATSTDATASSTNLIVSKDGGVSWQVSGLNAPSVRQEIPLTYKVKQQSDNLQITVRLEKKTDDGQAYVFWEKVITPTLVNSDLNLTLMLNGSKDDGAVTFGQPLNYSLTYANHGTNTFNDVVMMTALNGDFLDWSSLQDSNHGQVQNGTIIWTKNEIPALAQIKPGDQGQINFSLNLLPFGTGDLGKSLTVGSYGQYSMNNQPIKGTDNKSNTINSSINSDLNLNETVRYFSSDNVPVGSGPLPPQVGQKTSFKVYWVVKNDLHELSDAQVIMTLPPYVSWDNNNTTGVGTIYYDDTNHRVVWNIGRLPVSVYQANAEFNISIMPTTTDRNKILVLSPGSTVTAMDTVTKATITQKTAPKTTKLEDDDIASLNNSGIVQ